MVHPLSMFQVVQDKSKNKRCAAPSPTPNYDKTYLDSEQAAKERYQLKAEDQ
jgi:hypothetical protein